MPAQQLETAGEVKKESSDPDASTPEEKSEATPEKPVETTPEEPVEEPPEETPEEPVEEAEPVCVDVDGDGFCANIKGAKGAIDCNDNDKTIHPDAKETCNGKDDNCNQKIDDELTAPLCSKQLGVCKGALRTCGGSKGWIDCTEDDYNKHSNSAYETKEESCDALDNDCNGALDETFKEQGQSCTDTNKKGACAKGSTTCQAGKLICVSTLSPKAEICFNNVDDDCNGKVDESPPCTCKPGTTESCYDGSAGCVKSGNTHTCQGPCKAGMRTCQSNNQWGSCVGQTQPTTEVCDGKDNNCDGKVDETFTTLGRTCTAGKGDCLQSGKIVCDPKDTKKVACNAVAGTPKTEVCDGKDNNCDGKIDEGLKQITYYQDADRDTYGNPSVKKSACQQPTGYVTNALDCYDKNSNAHPKQTKYFTVHRGDNSFDYNCDKSSEKETVACNSSKCTGKKWSGSAPACGKKGNINLCKKIITSCNKIPGGTKTQACR